MDTLSTLVKVSLPNYLRQLPLPNTIGGFARLAVSEWFSLVPFVGTVSFIVYISVKAIQPLVTEASPLVNPSISKDKAKVVDILEVEDLASEKIAYCRCWRSKKFPYCDGAHSAYNKECGDNVGPLVITRKVTQ